MLTNTIYNKYFYVMQDISAQLRMISRVGIANTVGRKTNK